ncbi:MAG: type II toxin-antitoxin system RelE/ParE family toxin [Bacteroidetes Order II. Incertae sedis bacterium]|nr:type II toxin-antitoxin system RelE/ParE family toxin [Bacteroidetes Order II. bacterium]
MNVLFRSSFQRDLKRLKNDLILETVRETILQVENAAALQDIHNLTKISGYDGYYRIRIGTHRIGVFVTDDAIEFVRCLARKDIYRYFP